MKKKGKLDYSLLLIVFLLISIGLIMILSSSVISAKEKFNDNFYFFKKYLLYIIIGIILMILMINIKYELIRKMSFFLLFFNIILLVLVLFWGKKIGGAQRWISYKFFSFQPAEFLKLTLILFLADSLTRHKNKIKKGKILFSYFLLLGIIFTLIMLQPDLGTVISLIIYSFILFFIGGVRFFHLFLGGIIVLPLLFLLIYQSPYRLERILSFVNPGKSSLTSGFQITQSTYALGSGGLFGVGLGGSKQKLFYLPEAHTDFIFAILGEELGFLGSIIVIFLFILFIIKGMRIAFKSNDLFGLIFGSGFTAMIGIQTLINIAVVVGLLPTKGLPLPFISFGGSNLLTNMIGIGLLLNIAKEKEKPLCVL